jgi:hypothetical protein
MPEELEALIVFIRIGSGVQKHQLRGTCLDQWNRKRLSISQLSELPPVAKCAFQKMRALQPTRAANIAITPTVDLSKLQRFFVPVYPT